MKIKTSELTGAALDWAVAKCEGHTLLKDGMLDGHTKRGWWLSGLSIDPNTWTALAVFSPSTDWAQGGPIIERECISVLRQEHLEQEWGATDFVNILERDQDGNPCTIVYEMWHGPTPLIAAMRCYVASKLGDTVEIPGELHQ